MPFDIINPIKLVKHGLPQGTAKVVKPEKQQWFFGVY